MVRDVHFVNPVVFLHLSPEEVMRAGKEQWEVVLVRGGHCDAEECAMLVNPVTYQAYEITHRCGATLSRHGGTASPTSARADDLRDS
jgi:hypothetical protein